MLCRLGAWQVRGDVLKESCVEITLNGYYTLILATLVLLLGRYLVRKIKFLGDFIFLSLWRAV